MEVIFTSALIEWQQALYEQDDTGKTIHNVARVLRLWLGESVANREVANHNGVIRTIIDPDLLMKRVRDVSREGKLREEFTILALVSVIDSICRAIGTAEAIHAAGLRRTLVDQCLPLQLWMVDFDHTVKRSTNFGA
ncbi:MAG TPA: hypothetical protein VNL71_00520 [Chloroflexota bacterium]|nr:hypothetical protein [Chloroflexota bacterium]